MRIVKNELYKLISSKITLLLLVLLLAVSCVSTAFEKHDALVSSNAFKQFNAELQTLSEQEKSALINEKSYEVSVIQAINNFEAAGFYDPILDEENAKKIIENYAKNRYQPQYSALLSEELALFSIVSRESGIVENYNTYLSDIEKRADEMKSVSIFSNSDSFSYRNIQSVAERYQNMPVRELSYSVNYGITEATGSVSVTIAAMLFVAFAALLLICREKESGSLLLLKTLKKGRLTLAFSKIISLFIFSFFSAVIFFGGALLVGYFKYGSVDLSAYVQSLSGFIGCTLSVNIRQYLLIFLAAKTLALFAGGMMILTVGVFAKNSMLVYGVSGGAILLEAALYGAINSLSVFSPLKFFNLIALADTNGLFKLYNNCNFFGYPINTVFAAITTTLAFTVALIIISAAGFCRQESTGYKTVAISDFIAKINPFKKRISVSLFGHEAYKILVKNKALSVILAAFLSGLYLFNSFSPYYSAEDGVFKSYCNEHGGAVTAETTAFINAESKRFSELEQRLLSGEITFSEQLELNDKLGFELFRDRYQFALENNCEIVYDTGYSQLFSAKNILWQTILLVVLLCLLCAPVFSADRRVKTLIVTTKFGRRSSDVKRILISVFIALLMFAAVYLPLFLSVADYYGLQGLSAPAKSIGLMRGFPLEISILGLIVGSYLLLILSTLIIMLAMLFISSKVKSHLSALIFTLAVFFVPLMTICLVL